MIAERIRFLREERHLTQTDLANKLGITRSSVNAWEQGISVPSTHYIVELASFFDVSTDYLLGRDSGHAISTEGLDSDDYQFVYRTIQYLKKIKNRS